MRRLLAGGLGLSLGLWTAGAGAEEPAPPAAALRRPEPLVRLLCPVSLGRPVALPQEPGVGANRAAVADGNLAPAAYSPSPNGTPLTQGQVADIPLPMPAGPSLESEAPPAKEKSAPKKGAEQPGPHPLTEEAPEPSGTPFAVPAPPGIPLAPNPVVPPPPGAAPLGAPPDGMSDSSGACCPPGVCGPAEGRCLPNGCCESCPTCPEGGALGGRRGACCPDPSHFWASAEYLLWWTKHEGYPPLLTTSPAGTPREAAGVLGQPGTEVLFGGFENADVRSGGRFTAGYWFDPNQCLGIDGSVFFLGEQSSHLAAGSTGAVILARPFFNVSTGLEASQLVAFPGVVAGSIALNSSTRLDGADLNLRADLLRGCCWRLDGLVGFRYLRLDESLHVTEDLLVPGTAGGPASQILLADNFGTHNNFYGGQIGGDFEFRRGRLLLDLLGKVAFGDTHETVNINGTTAFLTPGLPLSIQQGGFLALPTNSGQFSRNSFAVVPEAGIKVGYQATDHLRLFVAYSLLYISDVARPASQIDRGINPTQLPSQLGPGVLVGAARPTFLFQGTDYWAQGISFGLEVRY